MPPNDVNDLRVAMAHIETLLTSHLAQQAIINTRLASQNERHAKFIYGQDDSSNPGARVRMDRLEQAEKRRKTIAMAALLAAVTLWVKQIWAVIAGIGPPPHP